jgi:hypothetical protein
VYGTVRAPLRLLHPRLIEKLVWHVPRSAPRTLRFCVTAVDAAGNRSPRACSQLSLG